MMDINDMLEVITVKDTDTEDGYSPGVYVDRVPTYGYKLRAKKGSFLEQLEIKTKGKFKLENDPENYVQEVRIMLVDAINKYYELFGHTEDEESMRRWVYTVVDRKLIDLARSFKSGHSFYDTKKREYIINQIEYFGKSLNDSEILENYINNINQSIMTSSKNEFIRWFEDNKNDILTNKQIKYLENEDISISQKNISTLHKTIIKRVDRAYHNLSIEENKERKLNLKLDIIDTLMSCDTLEEFNDIITRVCVVDEVDFINDFIYEELEFKDCKEFTSVLKQENKIDRKLYNKIFNILIKLENKLTLK